MTISTRLKILTQSQRTTFRLKDLRDLWGDTALNAKIAAKRMAEKNLLYRIAKELIEERIGKNYQDYLHYLIGFIKKTYRSKNILQGLGQVLDEKQKKWAKENLIAETISKLQKLEKLSEE